MLKLLEFGGAGGLLFVCQGQQEEKPVKNESFNLMWTSVSSVKTWIEEN